MSKLLKKAINEYKYSRVDNNPNAKDVIVYMTLNPERENEQIICTVGVKLSGFVYVKINGEYFRYTLREGSKVLCQNAHPNDRMVYVYFTGGI